MIFFCGYQAGDPRPDRKTEAKSSKERIVSVGNSFLSIFADYHGVSIERKESCSACPAGTEKESQGSAA
jgi:hypothetical protein